MATITGFRCIDKAGLPVLCDAHGNNVAFRCLSCGGPVLATVRDSQRGSAPDRPSECGACHSNYWVRVRESSRKLIVRRVT